MVGDQARNHCLERPEPTAVERATAHPSLALAADADEVPRSSEGCEQPKFCPYTERGHVLVKFSASDDNPVRERWRDLLLAEHLALRVLGVKTEVYDFDGQCFLEIPRFDCIGPLNVFPVTLPSLRERREDIPLLVKSFIFKVIRRLNRNIDSIPTQNLRTLSRMEWPGNVRELENVIERAVLLTQGNVLHLSLPEIDYYPPLARILGTIVSEVGHDDEDEHQRILRVLKETNGLIGDPRGATLRLGLKRTTLLSRMKRLGIDKDSL